MCFFRYDAANIQPQRASGHVTVSLWGAMTAAGPLGPLIATGRLTGQRYVEILENHLLPYLDEVVPPGEEVIDLRAGQLPSAQVASGKGKRKQGLKQANTSMSRHAHRLINI